MIREIELCFAVLGVRNNGIKIKEKINAAYNYIKVRRTSMKDMDTSADQGEGLFVTRDIRRGELVCFYSGHLVHQDYFHLLNRRMKGISMKDQMYQKK